MKIRLRYFAKVREALGISEEWIDIPEEIRTVGDLRQYLMKRGVPWSDVLGKENGLRMACQLKMADSGTELTEECEVAFFPPVTGG